MLHTLNYYDNINCFVIFGKNKNDAYKYYTSTYANDYILYGIKHMNIKYSMIHKIMYQLLFARMIIKTKNDLYDFISDKCKFLAGYSDKMIDITVLIVCKKDLNKKYPSCDVIENDFYAYIPKTKEEIWNCACVFLSSSTLSFLDKQNFDFFLTKILIGFFFKIWGGHVLLVDVLGFEFLGKNLSNNYQKWVSGI